MVLDGIARCRAARGNAQFAVDGTDMGVDGARAEHQLFGYLEVCQATRQQAQHLHLSCRQPIRVGWWGRCRSRHWGWLLPLGGECLLRGHRSSLGPGGSEGSLSQVDTRSRERALVVSTLEQRDGYAKSVT